MARAGLFSGRKVGLPMLRPGQWLAAFALFVTIVYPLFVLLQSSIWIDGTLDFKNYLGIFSLRPSRALIALWGSTWVSVASVVFAGLIGIPLALLFERVALPAKSFLAAVATLPIVLPPLVGVVAFMFLLGESGILPRLLQALLNLEKPPFYLAGVKAVIVVHAYSFYVYFFLFTRAALQNLDGATIEAAQSLGAGRLRVYRKVIFPQLRPATRAAAVLVFMNSMASFSAPFIFAGKYRILTVEIFNSKLQGDMPLAVTQSVVLATISVVFLFMFLRGQKQMQSTGQKGTPPRARPLVSRGARILAAVVATVCGLLLALPHLTLVLISFVKNGTWTSQLLPEVYTLENYFNLFRDPKVADPIFNSLRMAALATGGNVVLALSLAYWNTRRRWLLHRLSELFVMLPWAIPGTVIAIALIVSLNEPHWFTGGAVLVGSFWILPLAYFIRHLPVVYRASHAAFLQVDRSLEEAAQSLGGGTWLTWRKILLPAIRPGLLAGALLAMVMALGEFVSSILLYTFNNRPISIAILNEVRLFNLGSAAAYGIFLTIIIFAITWLASKWGELR